MTKDKAQTRTEATKPTATRHLDEDQKQALDLHAEAEHTDGEAREKLTRRIEKTGGGTSRGAGEQ